MNKKTIAFFGDSFLGKCEAWLELLCNENDYECVHIGKPGADPIYVFEQWNNFNNSGEKADICIYAHTGPERIYHPSPIMGLTNGVVDAMINNKIPLPAIENSLQTIKAAHLFYNYLSFESSDNARAIIIPHGIDRVMKQTNKSFKKIIHLWSFAQFRINHRPPSWVADSTWFLVNLESGSNVLLDLSNLSAIEPGFLIKPPGFDPRPCHFSKESWNFIKDIVNLAIEKTDFENNVKTNIDFRPYVNIDSTWNNYVNAFDIIKQQLK
jgi:hypothetical protein